MGPRTGTDERYSVALGDLWSGLARTLTRLDVAAAEPERLDEASAGISLRRLQYALAIAPRVRSAACTDHAQMHLA